MLLFITIALAGEACTPPRPRWLAHEIRTLEGPGWKPYLRLSTGVHIGEPIDVLWKLGLDCLDYEMVVGARACSGVMTWLAACNSHALMDAMSSDKSLMRDHPRIRDAFDARLPRTSKKLYQNVNKYGGGGR